MLEIAVKDSKSVEKMRSHQDLTNNYTNSRSAFKQYDINKKRLEVVDKNKYMLKNLTRFCDADIIRRNTLPPKNYDDNKNRLGCSKVRDRRKAVNGIISDNKHIVRKLNDVRSSMPKNVIEKSWKQNERNLCPL